MDDGVVAKLSEAVAKALQASTQSSTRTYELCQLLAETFGVTREDVRASVVTGAANITNRINNDNSWYNPKILAIIVDSSKGLKVDFVLKYVRDYFPEYRKRHDDAPWGRVVLVFEDSKLVKVINVGDAEAATN